MNKLIQTPEEFPSLRLREGLGVSYLSKPLIKTVRGFGYKISAEV